MSALWVMNNTFGNWLWRTCKIVEQDFLLYCTREKGSNRVKLTTVIMAVLIRSKRNAVAVVCNDNWLWNYFVMLLGENVDRVADESMSEYFLPRV